MKSRAVPVWVASALGVAVLYLLLWGTPPPPEDPEKGYVLAGNLRCPAPFRMSYDLAACVRGQVEVAHFRAWIVFGRLVVPEIEPSVV